MIQLQKRRLGRGLAALIGDSVGNESPPDTMEGLRSVPVELLFPNPHNPRQTYEEEGLEDLARSLREKGVLQPLLVRSLKGREGYEIVAGERRWRAAQRAQLHEVPVLVRDVDDGEALEIALMENIQRADLSPLEEARGYQQLIDRFGHTQQRLADTLGRSRSHIANSLRLLALPEAVKGHLERGNLTAGHARALVSTGTPVELAEQIIAGRLNVREAERLAKGGEAREPRSAATPVRKSPDLLALERRLSEATGLKVEIAPRDGEDGRVTIHYRSLEQLDDITRRLDRPAPAPRGIPKVHVM